MTKGMDDDASEPWLEASSGAVAASDAGNRLRGQAAQFEELRQEALSVCRLSWESPAGRRFVTYLEGRAAAVAVTVTLLATAARRAEEHADALRRVESEAVGGGTGQ